MDTCFHLEINIIGGLGAAPPCRGFTPEPQMINFGFYSGREVKFDKLTNYYHHYGTLGTG
jgi:hypothetical protein